MMLTRLIGAKFVDTMTAKRTNLLITAYENPTSTKARAAFNWKIPVVTMKWLSECIRAGTKLEIDSFIIKSRNKRNHQSEKGRRKRHRSEHVEGQPKFNGSNAPMDVNTVIELASVKPEKPVLDGCVICVSKSLKVNKTLESSV